MLDIIKFLFTSSTIKFLVYIKHIKFSLYLPPPLVRWESCVRTGTGNYRAVTTNDQNTVVGVIVDTFVGYLSGAVNAANACDLPWNGKVRSKNKRLVRSS